MTIWNRICETQLQMCVQWNLFVWNMRVWSGCLERSINRKFSPRIITMTSWWERWHLKSPASRLFTQPFIQAQIKEKIKAQRHWPLWGIHRNSLHKGPVTRKIFPFDDFIIYFNYRVCGIMSVHWLICYASYIINPCPYPMWPHTSSAKLLTTSHDRRILAGWSIHHSWCVCLLPRGCKFQENIKIFKRGMYSP